MPATTKNKAKQKVTLRLPDDLIQAAQEAVTLGLAGSTSAFIEDAVRVRARDVRHARLRRLAEEAMADADFVADMRETIRAFEPAAADRWPSDEVEESPSERIH